MSNKDYNTLMALIEDYADKCEQFGNYQSTLTMIKCKQAKQEIEKFLQKMLDK